MTITLDDLRGGSPALSRKFNKIKEEVIKDVGEDQNEVEMQLTHRILMEFLQFQAKKRKRYLQKEKRAALRTKKPKKPSNSTNINQNQENEAGEGRSRKHKRRSKKLTDIREAVPEPPYLPTEFNNKITDLQGSDIKLVIQKELTDTDMKASQDRLSIPKGQMRYDFLTPDELVRLGKKEADGRHFKGMQVRLIEPNLMVSTISLKKWKSGKSTCYMLSSPWINVADRNGFKSGDIAQLWSFRVNQRPHLALIKLEK